MTLFQFYFFEFSAIYILIGWAFYLMFRINQPYFGSLYSMCIGAYFAAHGIAAASPPFLDIVPVRFAIAEPEGHYHVPLLASPWSYATYRGS